MKTLHTQNKKIRAVIHRSPATKFEHHLLAELTDMIHCGCNDLTALESALKDCSKRNQTALHGIPTRLEVQECDLGLYRFQLIREHRITKANGRILERVEDDLFATVELDPEAIGLVDPVYVKSARQ